MKMTSIITAVSVSLLVLATSVHASPCTNTVQNNLDSGPGSLRYALENATNFETITFCPDVTGTITLTNGPLTVSKGVTILGPGANVLAVDGDGSNQVFYVSSGLPVSISGLTITNGYSDYTAGGIDNEQSPLTLSNCVVTGNQGYYGGGIYNDALQTNSLLEIYNCTLSGNYSGYVGGALCNDCEGSGGNGVVNIYNSTISSNSCYRAGGAFYNDGYNTAVGTISILNSTLSGNSSSFGGDGIDNDTVNGGSATIDVGSTILNATSFYLEGGTILSLGYNLSSDNGGGFLTATGDQTNTDPMLGPLQLNGGQTPTHALLSSSPAIDAGTNFSGQATDQRGPGFARTVNINLFPNVADGTDIGAFELQASEFQPRPPAITSTNSATFTTGYFNSFTVAATGIPIPAIYVTGTVPPGTSWSKNGILSGTPPLGSAGIYPFTVIVSNGVSPVATQYFTLTVVEHGPCFNTVVNNQDSGPGSLRYALEYATNFETITFCPGVTGTITLTSGQLTVTNGVTILGPGANVLAVDGNGSNRVFYVSSSLPVSISGLTITNGYAGGLGAAGGIDNEQSSLTLSNCVVTGNQGGYYGGGIYNGAVLKNSLLEIYNCTLSGNYATTGNGGALYNDCEGGGGNGVVHIYNSTISGNSSYGVGGAFYNLGYGTAVGTISILNSTFSGNSSGDGDGIDNVTAYDGSATIDVGSTILNDTSFSNEGTILSLGYNLSSDNGGGFLTATGDQINTDPMLGALQLNGGQTPTHALFIGSPAIDAGTNFSGQATDQRGPGFARTVDIKAIPNVADGTDVGAFELQAPLGLVTTDTDSGSGSLRQVARVLQGVGTVNFAPNLSGQTITLTSGEIAITNNLTIDASALPNGIIINGDHLSSIFAISNGAVVELNSLTLTNGYAANGGAIVNSSGTLALNSCTLAGNSAIGDGGAIFNGGPLALTACTLVSNIANFAGAIQNYSSCTMTNCTLVGNHATNNGGAIDSDFSAVLNLTQCTFFGNSAGGYGGGVDNYLSTLNVGNSILAGDIGAGDIYSWAASTLNLYGTNIVPVLYSLGTNGGTGSALSSAPLLAPLGNYGGPTQTMPPLVGSPVIDAGSDAVATGITTDQRGLPRVVGPSVDIGAVEYETGPLVSNDADNGPGSLRYVITYTTNGATISFAPGLGGSTVLLTGGQIAVNHRATIDASALTGGLTISGNGTGRVFEVGSGNTVAMNSLTITNGYDATGTGGGILNYGNLGLNQCVLAGNTASNPMAEDGFGGGGIYNQSGAALTLIQCTVSNNEAISGAGIFNLGTLTVVQSTISSNYAYFSGGGIYNNSGETAVVFDSTIVGNATQYGGGIDNFAGPLVVVQSTVVDNAGPLGGGGIFNYVSPATVEVINSIVAANSSDQGGDINNNNNVQLVGANIIQSEYGGTVNGPSPINADPLLAPLGNYGGPTQTMPPLRGSPAINAGSDAAAAGITTDQRGYPRVVGASVDIGSVEVQIATTSPQLTDAYWSSGNRAFQFGFTNLAGGSFTVFASTNVAAPLSTWTNIGTAAEVPPGSGQYQFTDRQATNFARRFYIISSP